MWKFKSLDDCQTRLLWVTHLPGDAVVLATYSIPLSANADIVCNWAGLWWFSVQQEYIHVPVITNLSTHWFLPNVIVAHLKEGIEAVHLATGRTVCKVISAFQSQIKS